MEGNLPLIEWEEDLELINYINIQAIPTIIIDEKIHIGKIDFRKQFK